MLARTIHTLNTPVASVQGQKQHLWALGSQGARSHYHSFSKNRLSLKRDMSPGKNDRPEKELTPERLQDHRATSHSTGRPQGDLRG